MLFLFWMSCNIITNFILIKLIKPPKIKYQKLKVSKVKYLVAVSSVVGPMIIEYIEAIIIPSMAYITILLFLSKHFLSSFVKYKIPTITPKLKTIKIGNTLKFKLNNSFILVIIGI